MAILPAPTSMPISPDLDQLPGDGSFDCHICLDLAQDPVVTLCGHLFCWPCLYRWLHFHSSSKECPVCKSSVSDTSSVIPLYGRGTLGSVDPRRKQQPIPDDLHVPHRPSARPHDNHSNDWEILPDDAAQIGEDGFGNADLPSEFGLSQPMFSYGFPHNNNIAAARSGYYGAASGGRMPGRISSYEPDWRSNEQRDVLFYRLYLLIVCVVIVFVLFF